MTTFAKSKIELAYEIYATIEGWSHYGEDGGRYEIPVNITSGAASMNLLIVGKPGRWFISEITRERGLYSGEPVFRRVLPGGLRTLKEVRDYLSSATVRIVL